MVQNHRQLFTLSMLIAGLALPAVRAADAPYPLSDKPITVVVPFASGSDTDIFARLLAERVKETFKGQKFTFDNRPGASGVKGTTSALQAPADGYTMQMARVANLVIAPALLSEPPYALSDFTVLAVTTTLPLICAVRSDSAAKSVRELLSAIRQSPGRLKFSTVGEGTLPNLAVQFMLSLAGLKRDAALAVHFDGAADAANALLDGRVDFSCNISTTLVSHIQAGRLRGLFTTASGRMSALPSLPNAREVGLRDMSKMQSWIALVGRAKQPPEVRRRWKEALLRLGKDFEWLAMHERVGAQSVLLTTTDPDKFVSEQAALYDELITTLGLRK